MRCLLNRSRCGIARVAANGGGAEDSLPLSYPFFPSILIRERSSTTDYSQAINLKCLQQVTADTYTIN